MRRLLAVGVTESWEGEWQPAQGNELAVVAAPIAEGEQVFLEVSSGDTTVQIELSEAPALLQLDRRRSRYRVVKRGNGVEHSLATTVEMILSNGSPST